MSWCGDTLHFMTSSGDAVPIETENIRRIVRLPAGLADRWVVYERKGAGAGVVTRSRPFAALETPQGSPPLPILAVGTQRLKLTDIVDLLLFRDPGKTSCQ